MNGDRRGKVETLEPVASAGRSGPSDDSAAQNAAVTAASFLDEAAAYALLAQSGWRVPRHGFLEQSPPFQPGDRVVVKGLGDDVWHKSEIGCVEFTTFDRGWIETLAAKMRQSVEAAGKRWRGALICERIACQSVAGLPAEALISLMQRDGEWIAVVGVGGLQAEAIAEQVPPLRWPLARMTPSAALMEFEQHLIGRVWLGTLRGTKPLISRAAAVDLIESLWRLAAAAERANVELLECNPVAIDATGTPRPLDAVGRGGKRSVVRGRGAVDFLSVLRRPRSVAIAGVSAQPGGIGRTILENLQRCVALRGSVVLIKPGMAELAGCRCVPDVHALLTAPVDLLLLAVPAPAAAELLEKLIEQGGGAQVVALVSGGLGDGADTSGLGERVRARLVAARREGRWTPAVLGPNFLGHWVPATDLDTSFIPAAKFAVAGGSAAVPGTPSPGLVLLSQSGAFLLSRRSRQPHLRVGLAVALGNQFDLALPDFLEALAGETETAAVAVYVEGFRPGELAATADAAAKLAARGVALVFYRAGRTTAGHAAAASHTGALAGDYQVERALLERVGVRFADTIAGFDAACAWLSGHPRIGPGSPKVISNAGFEAVSAADFQGALPGHALAPDVVAELQRMLSAEKLSGLVVPRLPLDLTPMAAETAFVRALEVLAAGEPGPVVIGLVPFTPKLRTDAAGGRDFAAALARAARAHSVPLGIAVDAGDDYAGYRAAFAGEGLPVFDRVEDALRGLAVVRGDGK